MVVIIGSSSSAVDISRDIAKYAKEVHVSSRSLSAEFPKKQPGYDNMWLHSTVLFFIANEKYAFCINIIINQVLTPVNFVTD